MATERLYTALCTMIDKACLPQSWCLNLPPCVHLNDLVRVEFLACLADADILASYSTVFGTLSPALLMTLSAPCHCCIWHQDKSEVRDTLLHKCKCYHVMSKIWHAYIYFQTLENGAHSCSNPQTTDAHIVPVEELCRSGEAS